MLRQASIEKYFKVKVNSCGLLSCNNKKKNKTATNETIKITDIDNMAEIIEIKSDSEECATTPENVKNSANNLDMLLSSSSDTTVVYTLTPATPKKTPQKSSPNKSPSSSGKKFFSPTRKCRLMKSSPKKFKRRLVHGIDGDEQPSNSTDELFIKASANACLKTRLFLEMIENYLKNESLKSLLDENSNALISSCIHVRNPGMTLICRLYWRLDRFYNIEHLKNISNKGQRVLHFDAQEMINSLFSKGFIIKGELHGDSRMSFEDLTMAMKADQLKEVCKHFKLNAKTKGGAIEALREFSRNNTSVKNYIAGCKSDNSRRVLEVMYEKVGPCYKLSKLARNTFYKLYFLMHMGINYSIIRDKKIELLLLNERIRAETYPVNNIIAIDDATVVFKNRDEFERYLNAHDIYEDFLKKTDSVAKCGIIKQVYDLYNSFREEELQCYKTLPPWLQRYTPVYVYIKILEAGIQELKKDKSEQNQILALEILTKLITQTTFRQHHKAKWYAEKALILDKIFKKHNEAAELLLEGFKSNLSEEAKDNIRPRARKIAKKRKITLEIHLKDQLLEYATKETILEKNIVSQHVYKLPMEKAWKGKVQFETRTPTGMVVQEAEEYCITYYINTGQFTHGHHWEGKIVTTIFFLLFWDIIYTKPPNIHGLFLSRYQIYPLDMYTACFYTNRKEMIDERLNIIEHSTLDDVLKCMKERWYDRPKHETSGISHHIGWENVHTVASCLGPRALAAICRRLATNYHYTHSGFPDLTLWNCDTKKIKFVEVKTDSDKPSMKQIQWMNYLCENGIDTEFCYVGANTTRCKSRSVKRNAKLIELDSDSD